MPDGSEWPRVSIVTPSYNQGRFLEECIRSVLLQGYPNLEYIIIDGGSTDQSVDIMKKYEPWLTYWISEPDRGQSIAINKGLEKSTGQYFNWQNADDILTSNSLSKTVSTIVSFPEASYVHGYRVIIDEQGNEVRNTRDSYGNKVILLSGMAPIFDCLRAGCQPGCLMRKDYVQQAGMLDENLHYTMDADLLIRLALVGPRVYVPHPVVFLRLHPEAKSCSSNKIRAGEKLAIVRKIFHDNHQPQSVMKFRKIAFSAAHQHAWQCYLESGKFLMAFCHFLLDLRYLPARRYRVKLCILRDFLRRKLKY